MNFCGCWSLLRWLVVVIEFCCGGSGKFVTNVLGVLDEYSSSSSRTLCFDPNLQREKMRNSVCVDFFGKCEF
jgi:hypothetical protein